MSWVLIRRAGWFLGLLLALGAGGVGHFGLETSNDSMESPHLGCYLAVWPLATAVATTPQQQSTAGGHILGFGVRLV